MNNLDSKAQPPTKANSLLTQPSKSNQQNINNDQHETKLCTTKSCVTETKNTTAVLSSNETADLVPENLKTQNMTVEQLSSNMTSANITKDQDSAVSSKSEQEIANDTPGNSTIDSAAPLGNSTIDSAANLGNSAIDSAANLGNSTIDSAAPLGNSTIDSADHFGNNSSSQNENQLNSTTQVNETKTVFQEPTYGWKRNAIGLKQLVKKGTASEFVAFSKCNLLPCNTKF